MVNLRDIANPIPVGMVFKYEVGQNVCYNNKSFTVHRQRDCNGQPSYLLVGCKCGTSLDKVLESECSDCNSTMVINESWDDFVYTGDNAAASVFMMNMVKKTHCCQGISYGPNADNTAYKLVYYCEVDGVPKQLVKNRT